MKEELTQIIEATNQIEKEYGWELGADNRQIAHNKIFQAIDKVVKEITGGELHVEHIRIGAGQDYTVFELFFNWKESYVIKIANVWNRHLNCATRYRTVQHDMFLMPVASSNEKLVVIQERGEKVEMTPSQAASWNERIEEQTGKKLDINSDGFVKHKGKLMIIDC